MSFALQTILLAACMALFSLLPMLSRRVRKHSRSLFLMGTGALFGICFFDLVPEVFELGGSWSLLIVGAVWGLYSILHLFHLEHHHHPAEESDGIHQHGFLLFFGSLIAHGFASGMLLAVSQSLSERIAHTVFIALLAHKTYESLLLASILLGKRHSRTSNAGLIAIYSLALPAGAFVTRLFEAEFTHTVAVIVSSIAVGTLLGCLIFDFLIPSFRQLRAQGAMLTRAGWILVGLILTRVVMMQV